jgi:hypothetical protein
MTRTSITANMTAAELAAWKANNRKQSSFPVVITASRKPARKSQRQEWQEFRNETMGMIEAAKRERHFQILPQLMQRLTTADTMLANCAFN